MKDNFSAQSAAYSQFRPHYPAEMIQYILSHVQNFDMALDVATGNGQVAVALAPYFKEVYATDISTKQLENAKQLPNIIYKEGSAEETGFNNSQFDLITVAQAIHWFDFDVFYREIKRVLKPNGILAVMGYGVFSTNLDTDIILSHFYKEIVGPYWDAERKYVDENYTTIPFPFREIESRKFFNRFTWTLEQLVGYLQTWSATQHYIKDKGVDPVHLIYNDLKTSWQKSDKQVFFPLLLRIGEV
ncbi:methyltransferase domain-containing protein [Flavobacterium sp. Sd200]|uniref:class I SAM-dependent methyltransferase n=1 Tax=Flavobacterium sp. Sd200 TaxID=2692211 RepID=UPI00137060C8|nr:class I SAM-dependent methyltransferase [Flavobacterium sp. Sd200]MXN91933.1 methyltransferase domain-containing protein [Flavobacterium sp. Sd200]